MTESEFKNPKSLLVKKARRVWSGIFYPLFLWLLVVGSYYLSIGIIIFPSWWKRAIFGRDIFHLKFISFGIHYLTDLFLVGHPLGVSMVVLLLIAVCFLIYKSGHASFHREGITVQCPRTSNLFVSLLLVLGMILSLCFVSSEYKTPEEAQQYFKNLSDEADAPYDQMLHSNIKGPVSGYFFYLDAQKMSQIFNSLREESRLASETSTITSEKSADFGVEASGIKIDANGKFVKEQSVVRVPVEATPEREAQYLIGYFVKTSSTEFFYENGYGGSKKIKLAKDWLQENGVILTDDQDKVLKDGLRKSFVTTTTTPNKPNYSQVDLITGQYVLFMEGKTLKVKFASLGEIGVRLTGVLNPESLDSSVREGVLKTPQGIQMNGSILAIEWKREKIGQEFEIDLIPLAIWQ